MNLARIISFLAAILAVALLALGVFFAVDASSALALTEHSADTLPLVMGGRYFLLGFLLLAAVLYGDHKVTAVLLFGYAGLGAIDTVLYWDIGPAAHMRAGALALAGSAFFFHFAKGTTS